MVLGIGLKRVLCVVGKHPSNLAITQPLGLHFLRMMARSGRLRRSLVQLLRPTLLQVHFGTSQPDSLNEAQSDTWPRITCSTGPVFSPLEMASGPCRSSPVSWACLLSKNTGRARCGGRCL